MHGKPADACRTGRLQGEAEGAARIAARGAEAAWKRFPPRRIRWTSCAPAFRRSAACCRKSDDHNQPGRARHRRPPDGLARLDAALLVPLRRITAAASSRDRRRFDRRALPAPAARHAAVRLVGARDAHLAQSSMPSTSSTPRRSPRASIAGTGSDMYSAITGAIGALRGPEARRRQRGRVRDPEALRDSGRSRGRHPPRVSRHKEVVIGFGHPVYTVADPRNKVIKEVARSSPSRSGRHADVSTSPSASRR